LKLGWEPEITVQQMCAEMVDVDLQEARKVALLKSHVFQAGISGE
jgi:GDPmannose 4,6-dehydratase